MTEMTESAALNKVASYCATAEHCRSEIVEKMQRWGMPYEVIERIADRLEQEKYIDEERYCRAFVQDKYRLAKWGKVKIGEALKLKKIPSYVYRPYLEAIDHDEYIGILQSLLAGKRRSIRGGTEYEVNGKLARFALSRGYEMADIRLCMDIPEENEPAE